MIVVVPVDPPGSGRCLQALVAETALSDREARKLYDSAVIDTCRVVQSSGGDLLVTYSDGDGGTDGDLANTTDSESTDDDDGDSRSASGGPTTTSRDRSSASDASNSSSETARSRHTPDSTTKVSVDSDPETAVRSIVASGVDDVSNIRFEPQVGSTRVDRLENTVTHLLNHEGATSVGILYPIAPLVKRADIDGAAMALRRDDVYLCPSSGGSVAFAGFSDSIDYSTTEAFPAITSLAQGAVNANLSCGFGPILPSIASTTGLASTIATIDARQITGKVIPNATASVIENLGLFVDDTGSIGRRRTDNAF